MSRYRRKPIEVDAVRWQGGFGFTEKAAWLVQAYKDGIVYDDPDASGGCKSLVIRAGGDRSTIARPGDYVLRGESGEIWSCNAQTFAEMYEPVADEPAVAPTG